MEQIGRFQILEELGRGTSGVVYRAHDPAIGRIIAIKSIALDQLTESEQERIRERILREARSAGTLSHPNIVTIYDVLESGPSAHIFMEFVDGASLEQLSQRGASPSRGDFLKVLRQTAGALDYAHRKGIVHRDVKPANIVIAYGRAGSEPLAKVADFGVAKFVSHESTQQGAAIGTPSYMSPEQIQGAPVSGASDQFSLAVLAYEVLCGRKPFEGDSLPALFYQICKQEEQPADAANPKLTPTVSKVLQRAMAKRPAERFASCSEFVGALEFALGECQDWTPAALVTAGAATRAIAGAETRPMVAAQKTANEPVEPAPELWPRYVESGERAYPEEERAWRKQFLLLVAIFVSLAFMIVFIVRMNSGPSIPVQVLDTKNGPASPPPDELKDERPSVPPLDLTPTAPIPSVSAPRSTPSKAPAAAKVTPKPKPSYAVAASADSVDFLTDPPGATVTVDNAAACSTPCSLDLRPGRHTLAASLSGFSVSRKIFNVPADTSLLIPLSRSVGVVLVSSEPNGSNVNVDGRAFGKTPLTLRLAPGEHVLSVWDGTRWHDETIHVQADEVHTRTFRF